VFCVSALFCCVCFLVVCLCWLLCATPPARHYSEQPFYYRCAERGSAHTTLSPRRLSNNACRHWLAYQLKYTHWLCKVSEANPCQMLRQMLRSQICCQKLLRPHAHCQTLLLCPRQHAATTTNQPASSWVNSSDESVSGVTVAGIIVGPVVGRLIG
jgi:hypothetical protein